jgi:hypothetical protein
MSGYDIVPLSDVAPNDVLHVINEAFGREETLDWFRWKHLDGPWGPSIGTVAVDAQGPIGVRLLLPWRFRRGEEVFNAHRATEAATIPRAQGRGVFSALNRWMMESVETDLIFSTPNMNSRGGYAKLGWLRLAELAHRWELRLPPLPRRAPSPACARIGTDWTQEAVEWRFDARVRHEYGQAGADGHRVVYRVLPFALGRAAAPLWASAGLGLDEQLSLAARSAQTLWTWRPVDSGGQRSRPRPGVTRGASLLMGWAPEMSPLQPLLRAPDRWRWLGADIEGVL